MTNILQKIDETCALETTLIGLRRAFASFKKDIDPLSEERRGDTRAIYWKHKHRIEKTKY